MRPEHQIAELERSLQAGTEVWAVHYSCESFHDAKDRPPAISTIAVSSVPRGEEMTFSVVSNPPDDFDDKRLLADFFEFISSRPDARLVHWNMHKTEFGFGALADRLAFVTGKPAPSLHARDRMLDLDEMIAHRHGLDYVGHPRLPNLLVLNGISARYGLSGAEQAQRYKSGDHIALRLCTAERARLIGELAQLFADGELQTDRSGRALQFAGSALDSVRTVLQLGDQLGEIGRQLGKRRKGKPVFELSDEYDYQDLLHATLRLFFDDVRPEDAAPSHGGAASRIDFVLPEFQLAVELKATRASMDAKSLGEELIVDPARYASRTDVRRLVCLVFDSTNQISNPRGIERDLSGPKNGIAVTVRIVAQ